MTGAVTYLQRIALPPTPLIKVQLIDVSRADASATVLGEQLITAFAESGYAGMTTGSWYAVWLPARTPEAVVSRMSAEIAKIVAMPDVRDRILALGGEPVGSSPAAFDAFQKAEMARWAKVIRDSGAKAE